MAHKVKVERPSRIRGRFRDGRVELVEVQASPVGVPTVYDRGAVGITGFMVSYDGGGRARPGYPVGPSRRGRRSGST
jgi:hypothetical protein